MASNARLNQELRRILKILESAKFEDCLDLTLPKDQRFQQITFQAGIYAFKSIENTILYVGQTGSFRTRLRNHHALTNMLLDGRDPHAIRLITVPVRGRELDSLLEIEKFILFVLKPVYNERIPDVTEVAGHMQLKERTTGHLKDVLKFLPDRIVAAIEQHADVNGMTDAQVLELAIVNLLDLDKTAIADIQDLPDLLSLAVLREENAILRAQLKAAGITG
jgi:GIY-YIG catalytic domain